MRHQPLLFKMPARALWILIEAWRAFAGGLAFTLFMVYQVQVAKMDPLQLVLAGTALEIGILFFEVPTGIVADTYSRRVSVIVGMALVGLGFIAMVVQPTFWAMALGSLVWGIGHTFTSGAAQAWLADEIGENPASRAYLAGAQWAQIASAAGIVAAVVVGLNDLAAPIWLCGILYLILSVFLLCVMPEDGYRPVPPENRSTFGHMIDTFKNGYRTIRTRPLLVTLILITLAFAAQSESYDRLWTANLLTNFTLPPFTDLPLVGAITPGQSEVVWFGVINMVSLIIGVFVLEAVRRRVDHADPVAVARALWLTTIALTVLFVVFANIGSVEIALLCLFLIGPFRRIVGPLHLSLLNRGLDPRVRATVISMDGQTDAVGQLVGGPPTGVVGNLFGVRAGITIGAMLLVPGIWLGARAVRLARGLPVGDAPAAVEVA
jgi:DHA3 family tetracycline resistance protein-like MFS transporter